MNAYKYSKTISILTAALLAQCVLLAVVWLKPTADPSAEARRLVTAARDDVERIEITAEDAFELQRRHDGWYIDGRVPADPGQVNSLLDRLAGLQGDWAVARSPDAAQRFDVAEEDFQRRVKLFASNGDSEALYLGTSPGFNRVHVRRGGEVDIYALALNIHDVPATKDAWLKRDLLQPQGDLQSISSGSVRLEKADPQWQVSGAPESAELDAEAIARALSEIRVIGLAEDLMPLGEAEQDSQGEKFTIEAATGEQKWQYQFAERDGQYYVQRSDMETVFRIGKAQFDAIAKLAEVA